MVKYACAFSQSETEKYFECIVIKFNKFYFNVSSQNIQKVEISEE